MTDWQPYASRLVARLTAAGDLTDPAWRSLMQTVPRHLFVPDHPIADAYSDDALVTQTRAAAAPGGATIQLPTSSASAPAVVAVMLDRLHIREGMRILEIGTGTGYNTALLARRLGDDHVHSIDLDPTLVATARRALAAAGLHPNVAVGDGYAGLVEAAPFDRIIATCAITHVPPEWIRQLTPNGRIVAPLLGEGWALAVCDRTASDEVTGHIDSAQVAFMPLRSDVDNPLADGQHVGYANSQIAHYGTTQLNPQVVTDADRDLRLFLHLHLPGLVIGSLDGPNGFAVTLTTPDGYADASTTPHDDGTWAVRQRGHRLWDTAEHALVEWSALDKPDRSRYGISALDDPDRQYIWLDHPDSRHAWPLPM